ncbi:MAG: hypothetical protein RSB85_04455 [Rikenellaceae bacterium]
MKKANLLLMMLASFAVLFSSCSDSDNANAEEEIKEITIGVTGNGGDVISVAGSDVSKDITISAVEDVDRDIEVSLSLGVTDGSAVLSAQKATIVKGTKSTKVTITFPASKFPKGTTEKPIKVTASTSAVKVSLSPDVTIFNVKGEEGEEILSEVTATVVSQEINTTDAAGVAVINFALSKAVNSDIEIVCAYDFPADFVGTDGVKWNPYPVKIAKGQTSLKLTITVPQGRVGSMPINFSCVSSKVTVNIPTIQLRFVITENPNPEASISTDATSVSVKDVDITKTIDIKLSKPSAEAVVIKLVAQSNSSVTGALSSSSVEFAAGEISKTATIKFAATDFQKDVEAKVTVTATSEDVDIKSNASTIIFNVAGPMDKQDGQVKWDVYYDTPDFSPLEGDLIFPKSYEKTGFMRMTIYSSVTNPAFDDKFFFNPAVEFTYQLTGDLTNEDVVFEDGLNLIYEDTNFGYCNFKVMKSAIGKEGTIDFFSTGTTFISTQQPCRLKVVSR